MSRAPRGRCLIGCAGPIHTFPLTMFLLVESFVLKRAQLVQAGSLLSEWDTFRALKPDLFFFAAVGLAFSVLISATGGRLRAALSAVFHAFAGLSGLFLILNHFYFSAQGSSLRLGIARYALRNFGDNRGLYASEANAGRYAVLGLQLAAITVSLIFIYLRPVKEWVRKNSCSRKRAALALYLVAAIALEGYSFIPALRDVHPALTQNPVRELAAEMFRSGRPAQAVPLIPESERMDAPLELVKDPSVPNYNVVLIIFESINWKNTDIFTPGLGTTPFLAELAKKGAVVERMYTVVPHTTKALVPLICGFYPYLETDVKETIPGILPKRSLAHILKQQGYRTAFFQTANDYESRSRLVANLGYDVFKGLYDMPSEGFANTNYFGKEERMMLKPSLEWIEADRARPFFLTYLTLCTHHDYSLPASYPLRDYGVGEPFENRYLNAVRFTDEFIRDLFEGFREKGLLEDTLFVIVGDHGEAFREHAEMGHNWILWEEGIRTFGVVLGAPGGLSPGTRIGGYRSILDVAPTVCDALGLRIAKGGFIGESLFKAVPVDRHLYLSAWSRGRGLAIRHGPRKYIYRSQGNKSSIYENDSDPEDATDLFSKDEEILRDFTEQKDAMMRWADSVNAQYLEWENGSRGPTEPALNDQKRPIASFDGAISLLSYHLDPVELPSGNNVWTRLEFRVENLQTKPLLLDVRLHHENGSSHSVLIPMSGASPADPLKPGQLLTIERHVGTPEDWPSGTARISLRIVDKRTRRELPVTFDESGEIAGDGGVRLGEIRLIERKSVLPAERPNGGGQGKPAGPSE